MLTLLLLRHAKSSWDDPSLPDHDRPLNGRGRKAAPIIGTYLAEQSLLPQTVLCSSAKRTQQTWEQIAESLPRQPELKIEPALYHAEPARMLEMARRYAAQSPLMLVGHNPGMEGLAKMLASHASDPTALRRLTTKFPTGALAVFSVEAERWADLSAESARLTAFITPRELEASAAL